MAQLQRRPLRVRSGGVHPAHSKGQCGGRVSAGLDEGGKCVLGEGACEALNEKSFVAGVVSSKKLWQEALVLLLLLLSVPGRAILRAEKSRMGSGTDGGRRGKFMCIP
jgi:hypothetical protein